MTELRATAPSPTGSKGFSIPRSLTRLLVGLVLVIAGCGGAAAPPAASPGPAEASATGATNQAASPAATAVSYPLTLTDDEGTAITIAREPRRIVSLSPANTETVFALGRGDRVVAGSAFDDYPPEAKALPDVATFDQGVVIEKAVGLRPDLVLAAGNNFTPPKDIARLRQLGYPVLVLYPETVDEVYADIRLIGQAIGAAREADAMATDMAARIRAISEAAAATGKRPRVFYELGDQPEIYGPAKDSFVEDMIELAGGDPITTGDPKVFSIPLEKLVAADPEVIVLGDANYGVKPEQVAKRPGGWAKMTAVRIGAVRPVDDIIVTRPGPRLADGLAALARAINPAVQLPSPAPSP